MELGYSSHQALALTASVREILWATPPCYHFLFLIISEQVADNREQPFHPNSTNKLRSPCIALNGSFAFFSTLKPRDQTRIAVHGIFNMFPAYVTAKCSFSSCTFLPHMIETNTACFQNSKLSTNEGTYNGEQRARRRLPEASWPTLSTWLIFCSQEPQEIVHAGQWKRQ